MLSMIRHDTDESAKQFYASSAWRRCRKAVLIRDHYLCQECLRRGIITQANIVHHIEALKDAPEKAMDMDNLETICPACHNKEHPEKPGGAKKPKRRKDVVKFYANNEVIG